MENKAIENFILSAKKAGVPRDQLESFLRYGYVPLPWQLKFHSIARQSDKENGAVDIGVGGARGPGKSHGVFAQVCLDDCQRIKGLKALFLRQTGKSASESFNDLILRVLSGKIKYVYNRSNNTLHFPNGSRVLLGGFETEKDIDKYIGIEYDLIAIEERNQLTGVKVLKLRGSLRTSREDWRPRMYSSFNPGGLGHQDIKAEFIEPYRAINETTTRFIPATYRDNPYLNKEYIEYLESLQGDLGRMWREGDWDIFAGQFFPEWRREKHVVEPFKIPTSWKRIRTIDPSGRRGVTAGYILAIDNDGNVYVTHEHYLTGLDADQHADKLTVQAKDIYLPYTTIDAAAFAKIGLPETIAEVYQRHGVTNLVPSDKKRDAGWDIFHQYLRWEEKPNLLGGEPIKTGPKLRIFNTCPNLIRTIPLAIHDENHPEDTMDTERPFTDSEGRQGFEHFDALDAIRYGLQTLRESKSPTPMTYIERRLAIFKER